MGTLLEQTRGHHEEIEKLERLIVKDFQQEIKTHKQRLYQSHRVKRCLDVIQDRSNKLRRMYEDKDNARRDEIAAIGGQNVFGAFYDRLKEAREYHRRYPNAVGAYVKEDADELVKEEPHVEFSGEESFGRYLDLHILHHEFINAKFGRPMEYLEYLQGLSEFSSISRALRMCKPYGEYLAKLFEYLEGFHERTQPLTDLKKIITQAEEEFEAKWEAGEVEGWEDGGAGVTGYVDSTIDLENFDTAEEMVEQMDMEDLKAALSSLGLKCGGTPLQRAERLFKTKGVPLETLDPKMFVKGCIPIASTSEEMAAKQVSQAHEIALAEARIHQMCSTLADVLRSTAAQVEKKSVQTYEELEADVEEADQDLPLDDSDDEEEEEIYNPLKLPLGWDGKPIPYWLYKLHGLNQEFKCEICGNYSYWGRRAYERHFREARHQHGMRCLKVPNTKAFLEVTTIAEAIKLHEHLETVKDKEWVAEEQEEYEDKDGNVYNKKTFVDLQRQGLI